MMGDFNKLAPAEEQAVGRLRSGGSASLRLRGKHRAGQVAAASAEPERPAHQTVPHTLFILIKYDS